MIALMKKVLAPIGATLLLLALAGAATGQSGSSPLNDEERELLQVETSVIEVQRALSAARKRGDDAAAIGKLEKKFDKLQKKRVGLLRSTWQM